MASKRLRRDELPHHWVIPAGATALNRGAVFYVSGDLQWWTAFPVPEEPWWKEEQENEASCFPIDEVYGHTGWDSLRRYAIKHLLPTLERPELTPVVPYYRFKDLDLE